MASTKSTVVTPEFFLASFSQSPGDDVWWRASQRSHVFADANSSTGRSGTCSATESTLRADAHGPRSARGRAHGIPSGSECSHMRSHRRLHMRTHDQVVCTE